MTYQGLQNLDLPLIMGCVMYGAFFVVLASAVVDVLYAYIDPRIRVVITETPTDAVLSVRDLSVSFATRQGVVQAVDGLSFDVGPKEVLGIVGESGSGKSVAMYSMLGLVRDANVSITGSVRFEGREILGLSDTEMQSVRGGRGRHDLPGPDDRVDAGLHRRLADRRAAARP